jgi:hypothetical protein
MGAQAAYKLHVVQREVTVYAPPPMGGDEIGLVVGISVLTGTVAVIVIVAFAINSRCLFAFSHPPKCRRLQTP